MVRVLEESRGHLADLLESCQRCAWYLQASARRLPWPLTATELSARSKDLALYEPLAAMNERFGKLQDLLAAALRHYALLCGEPNDLFLKVLSHSAKLGLIDSVESWQLVRSLRNRAAHAYGTDYAETAGHFNALHEQIPTLLETTIRLSRHARQNLQIQAEDESFLHEVEAEMRKGMPL